MFAHLLCGRVGSNLWGSQITRPSSHSLPCPSPCFLTHSPCHSFRCWAENRPRLAIRRPSEEGWLNTSCNFQYISAPCLSWQPLPDPGFGSCRPQSPALCHPYACYTQGPWWGGSLWTACSPVSNLRANSVLLPSLLRSVNSVGPLGGKLFALHLASGRAASLCVARPTHPLLHLACSQVHIPGTHRHTSTHRHVLACTGSPLRLLL